jgi:hypothetical protein
MEMKPFYQETLTLFKCVEKHDFDTLAALCDDDFGIIDLDTQGKNVVIHDREGWENWFHTLFARLSEANAHTYTEIRDYQALLADSLGYSVVNFDQFLVVQGQTLRFNCMVTIIWKKVGEAWKESRWHCSLIKGPGEA